MKIAYGDLLQNQQEFQAISKLYRGPFFFLILFNGMEWNGMDNVIAAAISYRSSNFDVFIPNTEQTTQRVRDIKKSSVCLHISQLFFFFSSSSSNDFANSI